MRAEHWYAALQTRVPGKQKRRAMNKRVIGTVSLVFISIAVIVGHLLALGAVGQAENGHSPAAATLLDDGENSGVLAPGEARWYKYVQAEDDGVFQRQMDLTLVFTALEDGHRVVGVNFQVFPTDQIMRWYGEEADRMQSIGTGSVVSRDGDPTTGELLWSGQVTDGDTYYIYLRNDAEVTIDYWLYTADVIRPASGKL